jgi:hypothetical protein
MVMHQRNVSNTIRCDRTFGGGGGDTHTPILMVSWCPRAYSAGLSHPVLAPLTTGTRLGACLPGFLAYQLPATHSSGRHQVHIFPLIARHTNMVIIPFSSELIDVFLIHCLLGNVFWGTYPHRQSEFPRGVACAPLQKRADTYSTIFPELFP